MAINGDILVRTLLRNRAALVAYAVSIVCDDHLAEDIFQDVSVLAYQKLNDINDEKHLMAWLRLVIRQRGIKALQKRSRQPLKFDNSLLDLIDKHWQEYDDRENDENLTAIRYCIDRLAPQARKLVKLRYVEGLSGKKLAESLGRQLNTVYVTLSRIHRVLAECVNRFNVRKGLLDD